MQKKLHFFIISSDKKNLDHISTLLNQANFSVDICNFEEDIIKQLELIKPNCILYDSSTLNDYSTLLEKFRNNKNLKNSTFILLTNSTPNDTDSLLDGFIIKPINDKNFINNINEILQEKMEIQFWGVRGTLAVPGKATVRYGGNTNCISLCIAKKHFFIFDAGTGIKELSNYLLVENRLPISAKLFISHPHYDHINGLPFFAPLYIDGNEFEIFGTSHNDVSLEKLISDQMDSVYFPTVHNRLNAKVTYHTITEESLNIGSISLQTMLLNHPGRCLGYRLQYKDKIFCYITDNELYLETSQHFNQFEVDRLIQFIHKANILVIDSTYLDDQYPNKVGWGHSCISRVIDVADKAKVDILCLHHHDPDQLDKDIDKKLKIAKQLLKSRHSKIKCIAPHEGMKLII